MKTIALTNSGTVVLVSDEDFECVNRYKWFLKTAKGGHLYAARSYREGKKVKTMWLHRFLTNAEPGEDIHHKNHDKLDCQRHNLEPLDSVTHGKKNSVYVATGDDIPF